MHDAAVPFAEISCMVAGLAERRRRAGRDRFVDIKESRYWSGVRMPPGEYSAARRRADWTVGIGAHKAGSLRGQTVHCRRADVRIAHMTHRLSAMFVRKDVDNMRS